MQNSLMPSSGTVLADALTIVMCVFIAGVGWGSMKSTLKSIDARLRAIEQMFTLSLRKDD